MGWFAERVSVGRRYGISVELFFAGTCCAAAGATVTINAGEPTSLTLWASAAGKLGCAAAFGAIYVFAAECYPTTHRSAGLSVASMAARIGAIASPLFGSVVPTAPAL